MKIIKKSRSINLAIEIVSKSHEANSLNVAKRVEQEAKGELDRKKIEDKAKSEEANIKLLKLMAESNNIFQKGELVAKAKANSEYKKIEGLSKIKESELKSQAKNIETSFEVNDLINENKAIYDHKKVNF